MRSIEDELTELVFEGLDEATALQLSQEILHRRVVLPTLDEGVFETEISRLELGERTALNNAHIRVIRYDHDVYDVEVNFIPSGVEGVSPDVLMEELHEFAVRLGTAHGVESYYAGLEPASDEETRFFSGAERGPYW